MRIADSPEPQWYRVRNDITLREITYEKMNHPHPNKENRDEAATQCLAQDDNFGKIGKNIIPF